MADGAPWVDDACKGVPMCDDPIIAEKIERMLTVTLGPWWTYGEKTARVDRGETSFVDPFVTAKL